MSGTIRAFPPVDVAGGITVDERAQAAGSCTSAGSATHMFVLQSRSVSRAQQRWEGDRREGPMRAGQIAFLPAGMPMEWSWEGPVSSLHVTVDPVVLDELAAEPTGRPSVALPPCFVLEDVLARHQLEALRVQGAGGGGDPLRAELLIARLARHLSGRRGAVHAPRAGLPSARLTAVLDHLEENLGERVSVRELAAVAGVETSWFTRMFVTAVGRSPYQYLLERRIVRAQYLLRGGSTPAAAAAACGFVDQAHLTRHFRRIVGSTPGVWAAAVG